jgi:hypothetical protein
MRRLVLGMALLVAVAIGSAASGSPARMAVNSAEFADERGEDVGSPDITTVVVSNDDSGRLTLAVNTPSHPVLTEDMRIRVWVSDANAATGLTEGGADYFILVDAFLLGLGNAQLYKCDGSVCSPAWPGRPVASSLRFSYASGARFAVDAAELGIPVTLGTASRLDFAAWAHSGVEYDPAKGFDLTHAHLDVAPAPPGEYWTYGMRFGPSRLVLKRFSSEPTSPTAGRPFVVRLQATRDDTGAAVTTGRVECKARIGGGRPAQPRSRGFARGHAVCRYAIPAAADGQTFSGSISVTFAGKTVSRAFVKRIQ